MGSETISEPSDGPETQVCGAIDIGTSGCTLFLKSSTVGVSCHHSQGSWPLAHGFIERG